MNTLTPTLAPELLAPAGDWDAMRAGVANGADAVYFGLDQFNARHRATNFTLTELPKIMAYLHGHNVKGFITFNTLIFTDELEAAADYIKEIAAARVDAVIVQDLGMAKLIHRLAPNLPIHGSTQMTLTEPEGIKFVKDLGVQRVVLARELGVTEIAKIHAATTMPLEIFVHGALCVAYSGQCLTSESLGGRSANRGQCAQACRLPYSLLVDGTLRDLGDKAYLLSPSDLAAHEVIDDLVRAGAISFKIEGRLKSAQYVAAATQTYRAAINAAVAEAPFTLPAEQHHALEQTYSRGFTTGFLRGVNHQALVNGTSSKARGTHVGSVREVLPYTVLVEKAKDIAISAISLKPGDGVLFDPIPADAPAQGGRLYAVRDLPTRWELTFRKEDVNLDAIAAGAAVWKTDDPAIKKRLEQSYARDLVARRIPLDLTLHARVGETLILHGVSGGLTASASWLERNLERANKFPLTDAAACEQLSRLGDTPFELATLTLDTDGQAMVPKSVLNDLRRQVCDELVRQRDQGWSIHPEALNELRAELPQPQHPPADETFLHVLVRSMDQLEAVLATNTAITPASIYADFEDVRRYPEAIARCRAVGIKIALATLRIVKPGEEGFLKQVSDCKPDALLVRHLGAIHYYKTHAPELPLIGDYALNVANELTAKIFTDSGLIRLVPSYDLNWTQLSAMLRRFGPAKWEAVLHQHMPMFHMEHCVFAHTLSNGKDFRDCGRPCEKHRVELTDRVGEPHPLVADVGCRNTLFNARAQTAAEYLPEFKKAGVRHFRIELLRESAQETTDLLSKYARLLNGQEKPLETLRGLRVLNQLGVTRGTLAHD